MSVADGNYVPGNPRERQYYDHLWKVANPSGGNSPDAAIGGKDAVTFFQRSSVDTGFLKQIWSLSTPTATMNQLQFNSALRFIAMIQNGEFPISKERLAATASTDLGLPKFNGIDMPAAPKPAAVTSTAPVSVPPGAPVAPQYAITAADHSKYHGLFVNYDVDRDGLLGQFEAMNVFRQSGLEEGQLQAFFAMADMDRDGRLTSKEFCVAFHLIICVSKKKLPSPPALPPPLVGFLMNAPAVPGGPPAAAKSQGVPPTGSATVLPSAAPVPASPAPITAVPQSAAAPPPAPVGMAAFDDLDAKKTVDTPSTVGASGVGSFSGSDEAELSSSVDAVKGAAKRALAVHEQTLDHSAMATSVLEGIKQRLMMDKVALEASVRNAQTNMQQSCAKLDETVADINQLQGVLRELRQQLEQVQQSSMGVQDQLSRAKTEREELVRSIDGLRKEIAVSNGEAVNLAHQVGADSAELQAVRTENDRLYQEKMSHNQQAMGLANEIEVLNALRASLREDRDNGQQILTTMRAKQVSQQSQLAEERSLQSARKESVAEAKNKVDVLQKEKDHVLSSMNATASGKPTIGSAPEPAQSSSAPFRGDTFDSSFNVNDAPSSAADAFSGLDKSAVGNTDDPFSGFADPAPASVSVESPRSECVQTTPVDAAFDYTHAFARKESDVDFDTSVTKSSVGSDREADAVKDPFLGNLSAPTEAANNDPFADIEPEQNSTASSTAKVLADDSLKLASPPPLPEVPADPMTPQEHPVKPPKPSKKTSETKSETPQELGGTAGADPFSAFGSEPVSENDNDPFTSHGGGATGRDGFDAFGGSSGAAASGGDGFDAFGGSSGAAASGGDGFDAFGGSSGAAASGGDGFDAFGGSSGAAASGGDGFDAFGGSSAPSTNTVNDPFAAVAASSTSPADDPFANATGGASGDDDPFADFS